MLCCLRYEHDFYVSSRRRFPKEGKTITTPNGTEKVEYVDIFRERLTLRAADGTTRTIALVELKQEIATSEPPPAPEPTPPSTLTTFDEGPSTVSTEQAVDAVTPRRHRRRRRRGGRRRGGPGGPDSSPPSNEPPPSDPGPPEESDG